MTKIQLVLVFSVFFIAVAVAVPVDPNAPDGVAAVYVSGENGAGVGGSVYFYVLSTTGEVWVASLGTSLNWEQNPPYLTVTFPLDEVADWTPYLIRKSDGSRWMHYDNWGSWVEFVSPTLAGVGEDEVGRPRATLTLENQPNPFNPMTTIRFDLREADTVQVAIFDIAGRMIRMLANGDLEVGKHDVAWDGRMDDGRAAPAGTYICQLTTSWGTEKRKLSLVR